MLYSNTAPGEEVDRVRLYPAAAGGGRPVFAVAVRFDWPARRVYPTRSDPLALDPTWTTAAEGHADGSVTVKGAIPAALYLIDSTVPSRGNFPGHGVASPWPVLDHQGLK